MTDTVDVYAIVNDLRAEVERRREAGEYSEQALRALHEEFGSDFNETPEAVAYVASSRPLASNRGAVGPLTVFAKRVVRRLLAWYVAPIAEDQTRYNVASIRLVRNLEQRLTSVEHSLGLSEGAANTDAEPDRADATAFSRRLDRLEQRIDELAGESRHSHLH